MQSITKPAVATMIASSTPEYGQVVTNYRMHRLVPSPPSCFQVSSHLRGLLLVSAVLPAPWERVAQLDFGSRPGEPPSKRLYCEVMAK